jgi:hypothetical protein
MINSVTMRLSHFKVQTDLLNYKITQLIDPIIKLIVPARDHKPMADWYRSLVDWLKDGAGKIIGAIGVSGGAVEQDYAVATYGAVAFKT